MFCVLILILTKDHLESSKDRGSVPKIVVVYLIERIDQDIVDRESLVQAE